MAKRTVRQAVIPPIDASTDKATPKIPDLNRFVKVKTETP